MRILLAIIWATGLGLCCSSAIDSPFRAPDWAIEAIFSGQPSSDEVRTPTEHGESVANRYFLEVGGERFMLVRFSYPLAMLPGEAAGLYDKSIVDMMRSRPGNILTREKYQLGPFEGERVVIAQRREKTTREVRLVVIGSSLYVISGEWLSPGSGLARAAAFFNSIKLLPDYQNFRLVEEMGRWRVLHSHKVRLRYDAANWYRDPTDREPGIFNFLRVDQQAEAQLIVEELPLESGDIETAVLKTAREGAQSVIVKKSARKYCGAAQMTELVFHADVGGDIYVNHGYFYSGPLGSVQLRGWATDEIYPNREGDIADFLGGLSVEGAPEKR